jgi:hypothetical protein
MNEFYKVIDFLKGLLEEDINVHTILHGLKSTLDISKKNIFPIAHIQVTSSNVVTGYVGFNFEVVVVDVRNVSKEVVTDKWLGNDNELDNLNTTHAVLNRLLTKLRNSRNEFAIELNNEPVCQPIIFEETNLLDGWRTDIELIIPNNVINVC